MKRLTLILSVIALFAFPSVALADVAPPINPPGSNPEPGTDTTQVRMVSENVLIDVPGLRDVLHRWGIVRGNRHNCTTLLEQGEAVAVFPGGGREAMRGKGQKYQLLWEGRTGFAKMAIQTGAPIVPIKLRFVGPYPYPRDITVNFWVDGGQWVSTKVACP